ncbi:hypothetical protein V6N12_069358 [Hibiscus sabdariffa]|uniref:RNase H type-1 domain-containing protein n=1 Tax=Hibiscus sabdariffa TaxID=183260 RepID=A0ABR2FDN7_9ROSI
MLGAIAQGRGPVVVDGRVQQPLQFGSSLNPGCYRINPDGFRRVEDRLAACGGMIRSPAGEWVISFAKAIGVCAMVDVELWGIYIGLVCAWDLYVTGIVVETDCLEALKLIRIGRNGKRSYGLVLHILELCHRFQAVSFQHIKRDTITELWTR